MTPLYGLVLAGGRSNRMAMDKASIAYRARPQLAVAFELVSRHAERTFVSVRADQSREPLRAAYPQVVDGGQGSGPIAGILAAQALNPDVAWLVVACDLPRLDDATLSDLTRHRNADRLATAFLGRSDCLPEPLCAIYEPASRAAILSYVGAGHRCPRKFLVAHDVALLEPPDPAALDNVNTPHEALAIRAVLARGEAG